MRGDFIDGSGSAPQMPRQMSNIDHIHEQSGPIVPSFTEGNVSFQTKCFTGMDASWNICHPNFELGALNDGYMFVSNFEEERRHHH